MPKYLIQVKDTGYVAKNKLQEAIKKEFLKFDRLLVDEPSVIKAQAQTALDRVNKEFNRCKPETADEHLYSYDTEDQVFRVFGVATLYFTKARTK